MFKVPETNYFQIGGYRAHSNVWFRYDEKALVASIMKSQSPFLQPSDGSKYGVELVLGVMLSGATYLLMSQQQMLSFTAMAEKHISPLSEPWPASAFISLSPIIFRTPEELAEKIKSYRNKSNKGRRGNGGDNSPANRGYVKAMNLKGGIPRSAFEHQRLLYRALGGTLAFHKFGLNEVPWESCIKMISFTFTPWVLDHRTNAQRLQKPMLLDVAWAEFDLPSYLHTKLNNSTHIHIAGRNKLKNQGSSTGDFKYGESELLDEEAIAQRVQKLIARDERSEDETPLIVLVYNEELTRAVLAHFGVDTTRWESGISKLLYTDEAPKDSNHRRDTDRARSRSPKRERAGSSASSRDYQYLKYENDDSPSRRGYGNTRVKHEDGSSPQRARHSSRRDYDYSHMKDEEDDKKGLIQLSSPRRKSIKYAPAYIVDVRSMCGVMMQSQSIGSNIAGTARYLGLGSRTNVTEWCAGNDAWALVNMWKAMADGPSIDEQRPSWEKQATSTSRPESDVKPDPDAEQDPNDFEPPSAATAYDPDDDWDDDY